ncbi:hypothetical protein B484DRAFT_480880 [Ochromonadaceae sp. CCMP2298]|nr:hypothetical protein B484DRAFT_480880 [Ochromonadaceae sp. CCMP2298]
MELPPPTEPPPPPPRTIPSTSPEFCAEGYELAQFLLKKYRVIKEKEREKNGAVSKSDFKGLSKMYGEWRDEAIELGLTTYRTLEEPSASVNRHFLLNSIGRWLRRKISIGDLRRINENVSPITELFDWNKTKILPFKDRWLRLPREEKVDVMEREGYNLLLEKFNNWTMEEEEVEVELEREGLNLLLEKFYNWLMIA